MQEDYSLLCDFIKLGLGDYCRILRFSYCYSLTIINRNVNRVLLFCLFYVLIKDSQKPRQQNMLGPIKSFGNSIVQRILLMS